MQYDQFKQKLQTELPINRKERFYTGTVLPSILFHNGTSNLFRFLGEIEGFPADIGRESTRDSFLFYTEYNLKESAGKKSVGAEIIASSGNTPDVVIEILEPRKVFVVIEAKMFASLTQSDLAVQMLTQKLKVIDKIKRKYGLKDGQMFHVALLPKKLGLKSTMDYQVIDWEFLLENEGMDIRDNYFANFLRFALEHYDDLVSAKWGAASTVEGKMTGLDIYKDGLGPESLWVGRNGGEQTIAEDVRKGVWREKLYAVNAQKPENGRKANWINSYAFASIVDDLNEEGFQLIPGRWYACEFMGDFFRFWQNCCLYSPIRIQGFEPSDTERGVFLLKFYHAYYKKGERDKVYRIRILERGKTFMIAKRIDDIHIGLLRIYEIDAAWIANHFPDVDDSFHDAQEWLNRHA